MLAVRFVGDIASVSSSRLTLNGDQESSQESGQGILDDVALLLNVSSHWCCGFFVSDLALVFNKVLWCQLNLLGCFISEVFLFIFLQLLLCNPECCLAKYSCRFLLV